MRTAINVEFTSEELREHVEDIGRRLILSAIHEAVRHINALEGPALGALLQELQMGASMAAQEVASRRARQGPFMPGPTPPDPFGDMFRRPSEPRQNGPFQNQRRDPKEEAPGEPVLRACFRIEANQQIEEGWCCHVCAGYNGVHRAVCRNCGHERCDVIITPPPGPSVPSESA